jgi:hypothetical protein
MPKKRANKDDGKATRASVKKEMAEPRVAKSARKKYAEHVLSVALMEARKPSGREAAESQREGYPVEK